MNNDAISKGYISDGLFMKAKELLTIITSKGYSKSTVQRIFNMARSETEADKVAKLIKDSKTEEELLEMLTWLKPPKYT